MQKYKAIIEYNGTNYHGMQKQKNDSFKTIQGVLEEAISKFANQNIEIDYAGRTDTGVHALGQVIHFTLREEREEYKILQGINFYLANEDIVVKYVEKVNTTFDARFSAKRRIYLYRVLNRKTYSPLLVDRVFFYPYKLNIKKMKKASKLLIGKKMDFSSFCKVESVNIVNTMKTINKITIQSVGDEIHFTYKAKSFLHNMIRIMTGILIEVGRGRIEPYDVIKILELKKRQNTYMTLPACGLYFKEVIY